MNRWRVTSEHFYCGLHFKPGKIRFVDGYEAQHPAMHWRNSEKFGR